MSKQVKDLHGDVVTVADAGDLSALQARMFGMLKEAGVDLKAAAEAVAVEQTGGEEEEAKAAAVAGQEPDPKPVEIDEDPHPAD